MNRIYYAMFYAVNALLIAKGFSASKHSGVRALFNKEIVNKGLIHKRSERNKELTFALFFCTLPLQLLLEVLI